MTRPSLPLCNRIFASIQSASILLLMLMLSGLGNYLSAQTPATGPKIWLQENRSLPVAHTGAAVQNPGLLAGAQPVSLASGDIDGDGVADVLIGYSAPGGGVIAVHRGNLDAFAPQSDASLQAIGQSNFPSPFLTDANTFTVPVSPDFIAIGNFTGNGEQDLVIAARGGNALYVFPGDGKGGFGNPQTVAFPGGVTALAAGNFGNSGQFTTVLVGVKGTGKSSSLVALSGSFQGLTVAGTLPTSAAVSSIDFANFGGTGRDAAFLAGGQIFILRSSSMQIVPVSLPVSVRAFAIGSFIFDRSGGTQIAVLASDGSVQIAARNEFDPRTYTVEEFSAIRQAKVLHQAPPLGPLATFPVNGWKIVDTFPGVGTLAPGQNPVFFRTRVSSNGGDDIMWLNAGNGQMAVISHPDVPAGAQTFAPGQVSIKAYTGSPINALPIRVNIDGRPGVLAIHQGEAAPSMLMPIPDPVFFPNRFDDPVPTSPITNACNNTSNTDTSSSCSLREAVLRANTPAGSADTIQLAAGTYTLTRGRATTPLYDAVTGTLNINDTITITGTVDGAGNPTSIITWGALTSGNSVDMVIAVNEDIPSATVPTTTTASASISNVIIQNGVNHGTHGSDGDGGCMEFDTGTNGTATLSLTNVIIQNCATTKGGGGGLVTFAFVNPAGGGTSSISNSLFQNNSAVDSVAGTEGGGIAISAGSVTTITNTQVKNNTSNHVVSAQSGLGGGIALDASGGTPGSFGSVKIHSSTISGNTAGGLGGGISDLGMSLTIDLGTVISGNTAGAANNGQLDGGGLYLNNHTTDTVNISHVTITGNSAPGHGGAIHTGNASAFPSAGPTTISFSRLAGNTAGVAGSNLNNSATAVTATNNWWGTNAAATTINTSGGGTTTFDPFFVLTNSATSSKIKINQNSILTGDMSKDNHGTAVALANLDRIIGLPITFAPDPLGSIPAGQLSQTLNASAQATATYTAGGTSGRGEPTAAVDQETIAANNNLIASATEAGTTATITTVGVHNFSTNNTVVISGVGVAGYNGTFTITSTPTPTTFTYTAGAGLGASSGGTANMGIIILEPPQITKSFGAATIPVNGTTTVNFSINNPNVVAINASFTDTLPTGLQVAATPGVTSTCGGTVTAVAGSGSISFSNSLTPIGVCTISVNITGTVDNNYTNSVSILSSDAGNGNTSSANLTVINPPTIAKAFAAPTIPLNGTTSLTFTLSSTNVNLTITGAAFTDNLPAGLVVANPPNTSGTCTGTITAVAGAGSISLSGQSLAPGASCTVVVDVQGTTAGVKNNSVQVTSTNAGTGNTSNASITVVAPPTISKAFGAASIPLNGTTSLVFTITNPNTTVALTGIAFSDTVPANLKMIGFGSAGDTCNGVTSPGSSTVNYSGIPLAANSSCTLTVTVKGIAAGDALNTTSAITSTEGGTGTTSNTATLTVVAPPTISKAFGAAAIPVNGTTTVTFTITNPAANTTSETGIAFSDTLTGGLQVASTPGVSNTCGGTVTAAANSTSISLTGGSIATPGATCTIVVNVTGTLSGTVTNTTGAVSSTNGGTGTPSNTATLTVASPATVTKGFGATKIPVNGTTSLTINITNPNTNVALTGLSFTDNLPAGLVIATPSGLTNSCAGTATATVGSGSLSLSGGTLAASASCAVTVNVTGTTAGDKSNSVVVSSTEGGTSATATASITVVGPPTISKAFGAASIPLNGSTSVTFTISNPNVSVNGDLTGVSFSDTLPNTTGTLVVATPNGVANTCGGTVTATAGTGVISLSGASVAHNASCTLTVNVTGTAAGDANNTTGAISSTEGGTGTTSNTALLKVVAPPSIAKAFNPSNIALNATTSLTFTITNPAANTTALTGVAFTDTLPTGLTVANATTTPCGGTLTTTNPTSISLSGATVAVGTPCTFSVTVTGAAAGQFTNTTGAVTSTNGGTGNTASANLSVATPPAITKAFGAASILLNASTSLTFNISNPNTSLGLTGIAFTDTLPAGLVVSTPNALTNNCGGTATAAAGSGSISLTGVSLAANTSCTISLNVTGIAAGVQNNTTGPISSNESGAGATSNTASITVIGPPSIAKAFGAASINLNATTTLSFTITNPNATVSLTGVGFGDTLPAGLAVANPNGLTGSCGSGTITTGTVSGFSVVNLANGTIAAGGSCTFSVNVVGTTGGHKVNTTGTVSSSNAGSGNQATASIDVLAPDPTITKTHSGTFNRGQTGAVWTITVSNVGFGPTVGTVTVVDTLPNVQNPPVPTAISGTGWTCTLATLTCTRADALPSSSSYPPITLTVNIPQNIQNVFTNTATVSGGGDVNPNNNTATDKISLGPPIIITPHSGTATATAGSSATYTLDVQDLDPTLGMISFTCSGLPVGTACVFNPPATNQPFTTVTMTVTTSNGNGAVANLNFDFGGKPPLYAALFVPVFGLVGIALSGSKARKARLRFAMVFVGAAMLLSFAGCAGGLHGPVTPAGTYQLTVTAASTTVQASAPVTLNVK